MLAPEQGVWNKTGKSIQIWEPAFKDTCEEYTGKIECLTHVHWCCCNRITKAKKVTTNFTTQRLTMSYPFKRYTVCETRCADYATHCNALQWDSRFNRIHDLRCMLVRSQDFHKFFPEILNRCNGTQIPNALSISVSLWHMFHLHVHVCVYIYIYIYIHGTPKNKQHAALKSYPEQRSERTASTI